MVSIDTNTLGSLALTYVGGSVLGMLSAPTLLEYLPSNVRRNLVERITLMLAGGRLALGI